ncbi:outer membrane lipoprotein carrier protein LolA [bacterium]|nr:outer membrane lipoprotein carrier protein LolA [bacterium]
MTHHCSKNWDVFKGHRSSMIQSWTLALVSLCSAAPLRAFGETVANKEADQSSSKVATELKSLQVKANKHDAFRVKFDQKFFSALRNKTTNSSGELIFAQPRKFRWEVTTPNKEVYVNDGEWFWKYVENTKHAMRMPANSSDLDFLDVIFQLDRLASKFQLKKISTLPNDGSQPGPTCPQKSYCVELEPLQKGNQKNIALAVEESTGFVNLVRIEFKNGNKTLITFNSFKPGKVSAQSFEFTPPPGTAVDKR